MVLEEKTSLTLEHALLGLLDERPMHAYEMSQRLEQPGPLRRVWRLKQSHVYALLSRLELAGYIDAEAEQVGARPARRTLRLTPKGRLALDQWLAAPVAHGRDFRQEFLIKLYFAVKCDMQTAQRLLIHQHEACANWLIDLDAQLAHDEKSEASDDIKRIEQRFDHVALLFRRGQINAMLTWLETSAAQLIPTQSTVAPRSLS